MNVLGLIPARRNSKGIPLKNIKKLGGKFLIEYTINSAKKSHTINKIIVSTDDLKISQISKKAGAEVPFLRPKSLSKDSSPSIDYVKHTLEKLKNEDYIPDVVVILQPTSPFRSWKNIDKSIKLLKNNITSIVSVSKINKHPYASFYLKNNFLTPFKNDFSKYYQRQLFPELFFPTGSIYTFRTENIQKYNTIYGNKIKPLLIKDPIENIDIDSPFDFFIAKSILKSKPKF
jgi:CMP-N,N'-diacetyllegionaminic acid synthase